MNKSSTVSNVKGSTQHHFISKKAGFTLIEILVVVGIFALILTTGALIGFDSIGRGNVGSERDLLVTLLSGVRAQSLANVNEVSHGIRIEADKFTLFDGSAWPGTNPPRVIARNVAVVITSIPPLIPPLPIDVIFTQLSGNVSVPVDINLTLGAQSQTIKINAQGRIEW